MKSFALFFILALVACDDAGPSTLTQQNKLSSTAEANAHRAGTDVPFCSESYSSTRVWGSFQRCEGDLALSFEARSAVFSDGLSANFILETANCPFESERARAYFFPTSFFRQARAQQVVQVENALRSEFAQFNPDCIEGSQLEVLLDEVTRTLIYKLSEFWHWSDERLAREHCRITTSNNGECSTANFASNLDSE